MIVSGVIAAWAGGDEVAAVVDGRVVAPAQADEVLQAGAAPVAPVLDVVQVDYAGFTAREPAPAAIAFPSRLAQRLVRAAPPTAQVQDPAAVVVDHPGQRGSAGEHLRGGDADRRAVLDVAPGRIGRIGQVNGGRRRRGRFRGNAGPGGDAIRTPLDDAPVHLPRI